jgi:hypothetical protein
MSGLQTIRKSLTNFMVIVGLLWLQLNQSKLDLKTLSDI